MGVWISWNTSASKCHDRHFCLYLIAPTSPHSNILKQGWDQEVLGLKISSCHHQLMTLKKENAQGAHAGCCCSISRDTGAIHPPKETGWDGWDELVPNSASLCWSWGKFIRITCTRQPNFKPRELYSAAIKSHGKWIVALIPDKDMKPNIWQSAFQNAWKHLYYHNINKDLLNEERKCSVHARKDTHHKLDYSKLYKNWEEAAW